MLSLRRSRFELPKKGHWACTRLQRGIQVVGLLGHLVGSSNWKGDQRGHFQKTRIWGRMQRNRNQQTGSDSSTGPLPMWPFVKNVPLGPGKFKKIEMNREELELKTLWKCFCVKVVQER